MAKSILVLGNSDSGLYDFRKEVLTALMQEGYTVHVSVPDTGYLNKIKSLGCICHGTVMERRGMNPAKDMKLFAFYLRLLKQVRPSAVLTYTIKPNIYGCLACRIFKIPYLVNITGLGTALEGGGMLQKMLVFLYRTSMKKAGCIFFQNRGNRAFMEEKGCLLPGAKTRIIPGSGVNLQQYQPKPYPPKDPVRFVTLIRIMKAKGIDELLTAAEIIHQEYPETVFELLGAYEKEEREIYEPRILDLQSKGVVQYYGYRDDVPEFYGHCQAVVHPTYSEGMSNVLLEAAATGRPAIASNIDGIREICEDGVNGFLFKAKDADSMASAIRAFLSTPYESRISMGKKARAHVEDNFDRSQVVEAYLEEIRLLVEG